MFNRRRFLTRTSAVLLGTAGTCLAFPGDNKETETLPDGSAARDKITPAADEAIQKGLAFLAGHRLRDGSFGTGQYTGNTAVTSLAALAFMAAGHQPNRGVYGRVVSDALSFILDQENRQRNQPGFLHNPNATPHGPMYGHGFATLFLAEVSGMVPDKALSERVNTTLRLAVKCILRSQNVEGGWRYYPQPNDADLSVTICQIMALRAARNAGVEVPDDKVKKCVEYVKKCQDSNSGSFRYMRQGAGDRGGQQAFARTAAGVVALYSAGIYKGREVEMGLRFLEKNKPAPGGPGRFPFGAEMHYFYGHYYAVQAMYVAGGEYWESWYPKIRDELITLQRKDGGWQDVICMHYATAMACLILQVPNNYLPILQK